MSWGPMLFQCELVECQEKSFTVLLIIYSFFKKCIGVLPTNMCVRMSDPLEELELQAVMGCHVGAGN